MRRLGIILIYLFLAAYLAVCFFPTFWLALTSIKPDTAIQTWPPRLLFRPTGAHYNQLLKSGFGKYFLNSFVVAITSVVISFIFGIPAAYALARFNFRRKDDVAFWILSTRMAPPFGFIIAFYLLFRTFHLLNTRLALIIVYLTFNLSFTIWMLKGFIQELPEDIEESAMIDGCTRIGALIRIVIPLTAPAIVSTGILSFIFSWNEFFFALILTGRNSMTVPVALTTFVGSMGVKWGNMAAASIMGVLPVIILALLVQKYLVRGLTMGALKG